jgi:hypothetical protein
MDDLLFKGKTLHTLDADANNNSPQANTSRIALLIREIGSRFLPLKGKALWKGKEFIKSFFKGIKAFFQSIPGVVEIGMRSGR